MLQQELSEKDRERLEWATRTIFIDESKFEDYGERVAKGHYTIENRIIKSLSIPFTSKQLVWRRKRLVAHPHSDNTLRKPMYSTSKNNIEVQNEE